MKLTRAEQQAVNEEAEIAEAVAAGAARIRLIETDDAAEILEIEGRLGTTREAVIRLLQREDEWGSVEAVRQSINGTEAEQIAALRTAFADIYGP